MPDFDAVNSTLVVFPAGSISSILNSGIINPCATSVALIFSTIITFFTLIVFGSKSQDLAVTVNVLALGPADLLLFAAVFLLSAVASREGGEF